MATVLIVDDEPAILEVVAEFARMLGHDVLTAIDGEDALALLRERRPDIIVSDVMMPRLNGPGLRAALQSSPELARVPILFMTAMHKPPVEAGASFIRKPFDLDDLERALHEALGVEGAPPTRAAQTVAELTLQVDEPLGRARALVQKLRSDLGSSDAVEELERALSQIAMHLNASRDAK